MVRTLVMLLALLAAANSGSGQTATADGGPEWIPDFEQARDEATRREMPLLVHFHADWCMPCQRMEQDVLRAPAFVEQLGKRFVGVRVDGNKRSDLMRRYGVRSLPSDIFLAPDGEVLARSTGYQDRGAYLARMERVEAEFLRTHPGAARAPVVTVKEGAAPPIVAMDGYSPVSLWSWREWRKGSKEFSIVHQGLEYYLTGPDELAQFEAEPQRYVPKLLGCDPVVLWETDRAVTGSTKFGAYYDGQLYFFISGDSRDRFKANPLEFIKTRHVLRVDEIQKTELR